MSAVALRGACLLFRTQTATSGAARATLACGSLLNGGPRLGRGGAGPGVREFGTDSQACHGLLARPTSAAVADTEALARNRLHAWTCLNLWHSAGDDEDC
ncbi:hypothetical protein CHLRE_12g538492v5 [Chlamydomonas reinhardtii]|uniref:Uncharacterized protein n=1 Tax=Chlamydomonas reinhardtii TaxID=3055 RepID=A0A2K3D5B8_CHLRE|nr:uncharacterized protein CHLRE_12g538492v5 [Chlamydomonas reinhardtii]PNW75725.1 hypothetical protein CHLRE_12g538492v5 [Chlamydomonas reinhardtii]